MVLKKLYSWLNNILFCISMYRSSYHLLLNAGRQPFNLSNKIVIWINSSHKYVAVSHYGVFLARRTCRLECYDEYPQSTLQLAIRIINIVLLLVIASVIFNLSTFAAAMKELGSTRAKHTYHTSLTDVRYWIGQGRRTLLTRCVRTAVVTRGGFNMALKYVPTL